MTQEIVPFDLTSLCETETAEMIVTDPRTGKAVTDSAGNPWRITLAGPNHPESAKVRGRDMRDALAESAGDGLDLEGVERTMIESLARRTLGWGPVVRDGQPYPYSHDNAVALYAGSRSLLRQVDLFFGDATSFLPAP